MREPFFLFFNCLNVILGVSWQRPNPLFYKKKRKRGKSNWKKGKKRKIFQWVFYTQGKIVVIIYIKQIKSKYIRAIPRLVDKVGQPTLADLTQILHTHSIPKKWRFSKFQLKMCKNDPTAAIFIFENYNINYASWKSI